MSDTLARRERQALCDTALQVGPAAPTCCEGWDTRRLVAHLLVRERSPWAVGLAVPPLSSRTERAMDAWSRQELATLVDRLRTPAPWLLGPVDSAINTTEFFVHHEDLRRAQPGWEPRALAAGDEETLWRHLTLAGRAMVRPAGVPVVAVRDDGRRAVLRRGEDPVVLTGRASELVLLLFDRPSVDVALEGMDEPVRRFRATFDRLRP